CMAVAMPILLASHSLALATEASITDTKDSSPPCVRPDRIKRWSGLDENSVTITAHARKFQVTFAGRCHYTKWTQVADLSSPGTCVRAGDRMVFSDRRWPGEDVDCKIQSVTRLPQDWASLSKLASAE
ncbi:MAG: hypothetical protein KJS87_07630, partial [Alphaproteobacteria bacterium]|nr:hypothetical protein [Alphaproteobacteria bacterium]